MTTQPEALRLADALEADQHGIDLGAEGMGWGPSTATRTQAAAELRHLHAEKERDEAILRQALEEAAQRTVVCGDPFTEKAIEKAIRSMK